MPDSIKSPPRRLRLFLRDFRMLEASASLADGQSLTSFLSSRKNYLHLQDVRWTSTGERASFAVLRVAQLLWAAAPDGDVPHVSASLAPAPRDSATYAPHIAMQCRPPSSPAASAASIAACGISAPRRARRHRAGLW